MLIVGAEGDNGLHAFRGDDGEPLASPPERMRGLHHFQTLIASDDRLYVAADGTVYAFAFETRLRGGATLPTGEGNLKAYGVWSIVHQ